MTACTSCSPRRPAAWRTQEPPRPDQQAHGPQDLKSRVGTLPSVDCSPILLFLGGGGGGSTEPALKELFSFFPNLVAATARDFGTVTCTCGSFWTAPLNHEIDRSGHRDLTIENQYLWILQMKTQICKLPAPQFL